MSEEERRRCIILGICGATQGAKGGNQTARRDALRESLCEMAATTDAQYDKGADYILGLIDEALNLKHKAKA